MLSLDTFLPGPRTCNPRAIVTTQQPSRGPIWNCTRPVVVDNADTTMSSSPLFVPRSALNWRPLYDTLPLGTPIPPAPNESSRLQWSASRDGPAEVNRLATEMFGQGKVIETPATAEAFRLYAQGDYSGALDSWKQAWFTMMRSQNNHWATFGGSAKYTYAFAANDILSNVSVSYGATAPMETPALHKFIPGAVNWLGLPADLNGANLIAFPGGGIDTRSLLLKFNETRDAVFMQRWCQFTDDWTTNFFVDADRAGRAGVNVKSIFVMVHAGECPSSS